MLTKKYKWRQWKELEKEILERQPRALDGLNREEERESWHLSPSPEDLSYIQVSPRLSLPRDMSKEDTNYDKIEDCHVEKVKAPKQSHFWRHFHPLHGNSTETASNYAKKTHVANAFVMKLKTIQIKYALRIV